ncbi:MAG TPA: EamA family transporter [Candidatus Acidoferrum sp.]|jgi:drug/metabolite transporter (DMT)-like permease
MSPTAIEAQRPQTPQKPSRAESSRWVPVAFITVYILWGSTYIGIRIAIESFPPLAMAAIRHSLVGLILYPVMRWKTGFRPTLANWRTAGVTGVLLLCVSNGSLSWSEQRVPSGIAALLLATISLWLVIVDWLRPGGTRPVPRVFLGLVLGFAGLALLVGPASLGGGRRIDLLGTAVLLSAAFVWACASLYSKHRPVPGSPLLVVAMQSLAGAAALWIAAIVSGEFHALHFANVTARSWLALLYLIVFGSGVGFTAYLYILKKSTAAKVATYGFVNPVVALFLGWLVAAETITPRTLLAAAVILTAVILVITAPKTASLQATQQLPAPGEP